MEFGKLDRNYITAKLDTAKADRMIGSLGTMQTAKAMFALTSLLKQASILSENFDNLVKKANEPKLGINDIMVDKA